MLLSRSLKLAVLGITLIAGGCDKQSGDAAQPQAERASNGNPLSGTLDRSRSGSPLPDFTATDAAGNTLELRSLIGKPLLINLWATWCAPCVIELPTLNQLAGDMDGKLRLLTVSQDMQQTEKVAPFLQNRGLDRLEPWLDPQSDLTFALGAQTLPTTILYDARGKEVWRYVGGNEWTSAQSAKLLGEALE